MKTIKNLKALFVMLIVGTVLLSSCSKGSNERLDFDDISDDFGQIIDIPDTKLWSIFDGEAYENGFHIGEKYRLSWFFKGEIENIEYKVYVKLNNQLDYHLESTETSKVYNYVLPGIVGILYADIYVEKHSKLIIGNPTLLAKTSVHRIYYN